MKIEESRKLLTLNSDSLDTIYLNTHFKKYWIYLIGILLLFIMAWRSVGYYHPDEHYQLLEFANYKSGIAVKEGLAWEYHSKVRPGLQPFIAYIILNTCRTIQMENPFILAFILRLISGILNLILLFKLGQYWFKEEKNQSGLNVFLILSLFLWFSAFLNVRFSSENWASISFFSGYLLIGRYIDKISNKSIELVLGGLLISLSFQFRYQMGFAVLGFGFWILFNKKLTISDWIYFAGGALLGFCLGLIADYWLYGVWQITPYKYFNVNITEGKAATFGIAPWWFYFKELVILLGPGLNVVLIGLFLYGLIKSKTKALTWICIAFLAGHIPVDHKEMRFLFPMMIPFIYGIATGWMAIPFHFKSKPWVKLGMVLMVAVNLVLFSYRIKESALVTMPYFRFIYDQCNKGSSCTLFFYELDRDHKTNNIYGSANLRFTFYRPAGLRQIPITQPEEIDKFYTPAQKTFLLNTYKTLPFSKTKSQHQVYKYNAWLNEDLRNYNIFQNRALVWKIYSITNN